MPGEPLHTISPLLPKGQHPLQNRSIFLPLPHWDRHWGRAFSCPTGTRRAQPSSDSPCPAAASRLERSELWPVTHSCHRARRQPRSCRRSGGAASAPRQGWRTQSCHWSPAPGAALTDRRELASAGKGKPRHITETRAPLSPARPRCGCGGGGGAPEGAARPRSPSLRPRPEARDPQNRREKPSCPGLCSRSGCPRRRGETKAGAPRHPAPRRAGTATPGSAALARAHALAHGDYDERGYLVHPIPHGLSDPHASTAGEAVGRCCQRRVGVHGIVLAEGGLGTG